MQNNVTIRIRSVSKHPLPAYQSKEAAGLDLQANLEEPIVLESLGRAIIPTGLFVSIPQGYELQIRARSGMAIKHGISLANGIGTIDSDYRGEIGVILVNLSKEPYTIHDGDRIAQMVLSKVEQAQLHAVDILDETERGEGGFGHSGF